MSKSSEKNQELSKRIFSILFPFTDSETNQEEPSRYRLPQHVHIPTVRPDLEKNQDKFRRYYRTFSSAAAIGAGALLTVSSPPAHVREHRETDPNEEAWTPVESAAEEKQFVTPIVNPASTLGNEAFEEILTYENSSLILKTQLSREINTIENILSQQKIDSVSEALLLKELRILETYLSNIQIYSSDSIPTGMQIAILHDILDARESISKVDEKENILIDSEWKNGLWFLINTIVNSVLVPILQSLVERLLKNKKTSKENKEEEALEEALSDPYHPIELKPNYEWELAVHGQLYTQMELVMKIEKFYGLMQAAEEANTASRKEIIQLKVQTETKLGISFSDYVDNSEYNT